MTSFEAMTRSFERARAASTVTDEQYAEFIARERDELVKARLSCANIPAEFRDADVRRCPEAVRGYAREVWQGGCPDMLLSGQVGRGKTYAACAVLNACVPKVRPKFVTAQDIAQHARSFDGAEWLDRCKGVGLLVIDDLGNEEPHAKGIAALKDILDRRRNRRPTVVTTQLVRGNRAVRLGELYGAEHAKAIASRLQLLREVSMVGEDRRRA